MGDKRFQDKVFLVTGGASGIGRSAALIFAHEGARVAVVDVMREDGEKTVAEIEQAGGTAIFIQVDVSSIQEVKNMVDQVITTYGGIDFAFNNAGIDHAFLPFHEVPEDAWDRVNSVNLRGVWLCMKYELSQMVKQGFGVIVNNASVAGLVGTPGLCGYAASKSGINAMTRSAAVEYGSMGIRVNSICPGIILTPLTDKLKTNSPGVAELILQRIPANRFAEPEEVARVVRWLCDDESSYVTGVCLPVDGGLRA